MSKKFSFEFELDGEGKVSIRCSREMELSTEEVSDMLLAFLMYNQELTCTELVHDLVQSFLYYLEESSEQEPQLSPWIAIGKALDKMEWEPKHDLN